VERGDVTVGGGALVACGAVPLNPLVEPRYYCCNDRINLHPVESGGEVLPGVFGELRPKVV